ncbi:M20 family metallopeptidase [Agromyces sp. G08B096]|uniref:M20 family metallopeptidase n=1 Tax=Agromyces sp. G08B096 TaxID=3156399 RepID=A0AAU7W6C4_9MICO
MAGPMPGGAVTPARPAGADLLAAARRLDAAFRRDLEAAVSIDSGSWSPDGVGRMAAWAADRLTADGFLVERIPTPETAGARFADVVVGRRRGTGSARVLLFAHLDTVFADGVAAERPYRVSGDRAYGPGVCDDKGGLVAGLTAARVLAETGWDGYGELVLAFTPDEEVGSPASRDILAALASESDVALCLECARENGDLVGARKGVADLRVTVRGRAAHSGVEPERGVNAAVEAAHLVLEFQGLSATRPGLTVNVGRVRSGSRPNIVPDGAELQVEVRAERTDDLLAAFDAFDDRAARPVVTGAAVSIERLDVCPPLEPAATDALAAVARRVGKELGLAFEIARTGGASDANFVAATGVPTLDGLGPVGGGDHGVDEWLDLASVPERVALLAGVIAECCR